MKKMKCLITVFLLLFLSSPVYADDFQDGLDAYNRKDYTVAYENWKPLAEQGDARAQFCLGVMYINGYGVPKNYIQAHMWLNLAGVDGDKKTEELRNFVEERMTPFDISEAQKLASEWMEKHGKN